MNDNFFFTVYDLLPLLERFRPNKHISSGKLKARQRENDKLEADDDGSFKIRTVSGTNLIDVKIDTNAGLGKKKRNELKRIIVEAIKETLNLSWTLVGLIIATLTLTGSARQITGVATIITLAIWLLTISFRKGD